MRVGDIAPDFELMDQDGNPFRLYENLDTKIMLVFYPKDNSPVCTKQLCDYNENFFEFREREIKIIGISLDDSESHKNFSKQNNFRFPLLSDTGKTVSKMYDALYFLDVSKRKIVVISENKEVIYQSTMVPALFQSSEKLLNDKLKKISDTL
ncbi:MAG: peroxiredoxin [Melioribacteraceae bacterium]|nr:peroxiredoxin [Melioribacteraceae bacterium]MCF8355257.1 peroxiredoxin [Melioribacteraceae bacterium]MCF8394156.1 peroxiredoxin [Melioribacteraceae bacterium]MCF8418839.1 peroxiredoxin [Melioribacteraceae bacterium]